MDKDEYDRPQDEETTRSNALTYLFLAIVVVAIFFVIFNTDVFG